MRHTSRTLLALVAGFVVGAVISRSGNGLLVSIPRWIEPIGTIWVNALRMMVIPLIIPAILIGIGSLPGARGVGRIGGRLMVVVVATLVLAASFASAFGPIILSRLTIDSDAVAALRAGAKTASEGAARSAQQLGGVADWVGSLVPINPIKAAADGALAPLIVFTVLFAVALLSVPEAERNQLMRGVRAVYSAAVVMVRWVLNLAPIGVFALAVALASKLGFAAAGAVAFYVAVVSAMTLGFTLVFYLMVWLFAEQSVAVFARACAPAQAVALSSRSSLSCLPAMLDGADGVLGLELSVRSFVLPLAVAIFRPGGAIAIPIGVLFLARLYGIELGAAQLVMVTAWSVITTFSAAGIPGGSIIVMVPVLLSAGLPVDAVGLLIAVDAIPDMCRTVANVTGDMAVAAIVARFDRAVPNAEVGVSQPSP